MTQQTIKPNLLPPWPGLVAGALVALGVLLWMFVAKGLLFIAGLGAFGPGILRELGWLKDQDEFQRQAARRAGYHAYLIGGLAAVFVVSVLEWPAAQLDVSIDWVRLIVIILWLTWMFSALLAYWGAQKTTTRVLRTVGAFWALFALGVLFSEASTNSLWENLQGVLAALLIVGPFFVLAWTASRWPRITGGLLLAVAVFFVGFFFSPNGPLQMATALLRDTLLVVPLGACGIALLRERPDDDELDEDETAEA